MSKSNLKRKLESDGEDELFFANESDNKITKRKSCEEQKKVELKSENKIQLDQKCNNKENKKSSITTSSNTPIQNKSTSTAPLSSSSKLLIQQKLSFSPSVKSSTANISTTSIQIKPIERPNGEWLIEDYLVDEEWRKCLEDEFDKKYFKEINLVLKPGYQKNIIRPPKELVFNALNSTKLDNIKVVIIGQDPYHDDGQVRK